MRTDFLGVRGDPEFRPLNALILWVSGLGALCLLIQALVPPAHLRFVQRAEGAVLVMVCIAGAIRRGRMPGEPRNAWGFFALAFTIHAFVMLLPFGSKFPDTGLLILTLLYVGLMVSGMTSWFGEGLLWAGGIRRVLEGAIFALALITLSWQSLMSVDIDLIPFNRIRLLLNLSVFSIILGVALYQAQVDLKRLRGPLGWLGIGMILALVQNLIQVRALLSGTWSWSHPAAVLDPLVHLTFLIMISVDWTRDTLTREEGRGQNPWGGFLAYLPFAIGLIWTLASLRPGVTPDPLLLLLFGLQAIILLVRQLMAIRDQASFFSILNAKLDERTRSLEEHQNILMRTQRMNLVATLGAGLAHDFNNLLAAMVSMSEQGRTQEAIATARKAATLAQRMMNMAHPEDRKLELFDLAGLLRDHHRLLSRLAGRGIILSLDIAPGEYWMEADPLAIEQVLVNLVTNARDAMEGQGTVSLRLSGQNPACLEVQDTGSGMDPNVLSRLFQPFFTTKGEGRGTGLGLASVKATVDQLGGRVEVDSQVGVGTTFTLFLPVVEVD